MSAPASMNRQIPEAVVGLLVLALMTLAAPAPAAVIVWNNVGTAWSLDADWIGPHAPINDLTTDIADFNAASYTNQPIIDADRSVTGIQIDATSGLLTIGGSNRLTLGSSGIGVASGAGAVTISANLALGAAQSWTNNSAYAVTVSGSIAGTSGFGLAKSGTGVLALSGVNTYAGGTTISGGMLSVWNEANLGDTTSTASLSGGTLQLGAMLLGSTNLANPSPRTVNISTASAIDVPRSYGNVSTAVAANFNNANLTGSAALTKTGAGTLRLLQTNSAFTGAVTLALDGGTLALRDAGTLTGVASFTVNPGATLSHDDTGLPVNPNRLDGSAAINLQGGNFAFSAANTSSATTASVSVGSISLAKSSFAAGSGTASIAGANTITVTPLGAGGANLTIGNLVRNAGDGTVNFTGTGFTGATSGTISRVVLTQVNGTAPTVDSLVGGWATINGADFASYATVGSPGGGVVIPGQAGTTGYATLSTATAPGANGWGAGNIGSLTGNATLGQTGAGQVFDVGALKMSTATALTFLGTTSPPDTLYVGSGGILTDAGTTIKSIGVTTNANTRGMLTAGSSTIAAGTPPVELFLHNNAAIAAANALTINSVITDNTANGTKPLTLIKDGAGLAILSGGNTYTGGTQVLGGQLNVTATASLGGTATGTGVSGTAYVNNAILNLAISQSSARNNLSLTTPGVVVVNGGELLCTQGRGTHDFVSVDKTSIFAQSGSSVANWDVGPSGNASVAGGAVISESAGGLINTKLKYNNALFNTYANNAPITTPTWLFGIGGTVAETLTVGAGTPWLGISTDRGTGASDTGRILATGSVITAASDFTLGSFQIPGNTVVSIGYLQLGNAVTDVVTINTSTATNANIVGSVFLKAGAAVYGSTANPLTFQVTPGAAVKGYVAHSMGGSNIGDASTTASLVVQNGGRLYNAVPDAFNGSVTVQSGGFFEPSLAAGLTGTGTMTFNNGSIIAPVSQAAAFSGTQVSSHVVINPGTIFRLSIGNITGTGGATFDQTLLSDGNTFGSHSPIYETFSSTGSNYFFANPGTPGQIVMTLNQSASGIGGIYTNDAYSHNMATVATANGQIVVGPNGGTIAATTGTKFTLGAQAIDLAGHALTFGYAGSIDGYAKLGTVQVNSGAITSSGGGGQVGILAGVTLQPTSQTTTGTPGALLPAGSTLNIASGGTLDLNNMDNTASPPAAVVIGGLTGGGTVTNTGATNNSTLSLTGGTNTFPGVIQDGGVRQVALTVNGANQTLSGANNTYSGGTTVIAGTLVAANTSGSATGTGTVTLKGGTLASGAVGSISGAVLAGNDNHTIAPGGLLSVGTLNLTSLSLNEFSTLNFDVSGTTHDLLAISGQLSIGFLYLDIKPTITLTSNALSGDYTLATYNSAGISKVNFNTLPDVPDYTWEISTTSIKLVSNGPVTSTWNKASGGSWNAGGNWNGGQPNAIGANAEFGSVAASAAVTVDTNNVIAGSIKFTTSNTYTVNGPNSITMQVNTGNAAIDIQQSVTQTIKAPLVIASSTDISGPGSLITGNITTNGSQTLTINTTVAADKIDGAGNISVNGSLTADSIVQNTLTIGAGAIVTIRETTGGSVNAVPEPGTWVLIGTAILGWLAFRRRQR